MGTDWPHVDRHALPRRIKQLMTVEQARHTSFALAREQLQERSEVLRAHNFARKRAMEEMKVTRRVVPGGLERCNRSSSPSRVNEV